MSFYAQEHKFEVMLSIFAIFVIDNCIFRRSSSLNFNVGKHSLAEAIQIDIRTLHIIAIYLFIQLGIFIDENIIELNEYWFKQKLC